MEELASFLRDDELPSFSGPIRAGIGLSGSLKLTANSSSSISHSRIGGGTKLGAEFDGEMGIGVCCTGAGTWTAGVLVGAFSASFLGCADKG